MVTILPNAEDKLLTMGDLYYCTDDVDFATITKLTATNQATVKAQLDGFTYASVGHINDFAISHSLQNEEIIRAGNCGVGELARLSEKTPTISWTWLDINNRPVFDKFLGLDLLNVAASPVSVTNEIIKASGSSAAGEQYTLLNYDGDGTLVGSIVVQNNATPLVLNTDYTVSLVGGRTVITFITVNAATGIGLNVDYSYTPNASTLDGYNIEKEAVPYVLCKFVSCPNQFNSTQAIVDTVYFWKYTLSGEMVENYILLSEDTQFEGSPISLVGVTGGGYLKQKATVAA